MSDPDRITSPVAPRLGEPVMLDTHIWVWLLDGEPAISQSRGLQLAEAAAEQGLLRLSAVSLWEVAMLEAAGRLRFTTSLLGWLAEAAETPGIEIVQLNSEIAVESTRLPGAFAGDSIDRIIVSTARILSARLITADPEILAYGAEGYLDVEAVEID